MFANLIKRVSARAVIASLLALSASLLPGTAEALPGIQDVWDDALFSDDPGESPRYRITDVEVSHVAGLRRRTVTVQAGANPTNRFFMHRVSKPFPYLPKGVILILPPLIGNFEGYEVGENGNYEKSFVGYFASRGYDVWGYSQRAQGITAGSCESGAVDCSVMANWGIQTIVDDVAFIRRKIGRARPLAPVAVGGLSLGGIAALAVVNDRPHAYAGLFSIDGTLYTGDAETQGNAQQFCDDLDDEIAQGVFYDGQNIPGFKLINALAAADPNGPSPLPPPFAGLTNRQAFLGAVSTAAVTDTSPSHEMFLLAGNLASGQLSFANEALFHANVATSMDYITKRTLRDFNCGLAGETTFVDRLGAYRGAVFMTAAGHGLGGSLFDTVALMPHADVTMRFAPAFGHVDLFFAENHRQMTEKPILDWLEHDVFN